ncbi:hypothetical protein OPT61_g5890 [Boeremia exigua]|uniref:Uncharacterized protein n=1 Tax=Boeremia exigua TaxID=749465 RepID=A0ACC2I8U2_9PLEO|nr:hypothetical protein OPT61_g5890 [Boeremia exigua]
MDIPKGTKTAAAGAVAAASLSTILFDPTPVSALTFLGASTATVVGTTYHAVKETAKFVSKSMDKNRQRISERQAQDLKMTKEQHKQFQHEIENTIRRLTSSLEGTLVSTVLFIGLPFMGIYWFFNLSETGIQIKHLSMLAERAGGRRALVGTISKRNAALQATMGAVIKTGTLAITLGNDFDAAMNSIASHVSDSDYNALLKEAGGAHKNWLEESFIEHTTDAVDKPQDLMKNMLEALEGDFDNVPKDWNWEENHSAAGIVALGATVAVVNKTIDHAVDRNLHHIVDATTTTVKKQ